MESPNSGKVSEAAEDISGFGVPALRTLRDLVLRPEAIVAAMETGGATGGGRYATPLRFFLALNGVMMLVFFLFGGMEGAVGAAFPEELIAKLSASADKSVDAWMADFDQWSSLVLVPLIGMSMVGAAVPLVAAWRKKGWLSAFRESMTAINSWTVFTAALSPIIYTQAIVSGDRAIAAQVGMFVLFVYPFVRVGRGLWFTTVSGGVAKGALMIVVLLISSTVGSLLVWLTGFLGAMYA